MNYKSVSANTYMYITGYIISCLFGVIFLTVGLINIFWGNDTGYGVFIFILSLLFFPPVTDLVRRYTNLSFTWVAKVLLALFIIWSALGVGELFDKIEMMKNSF